MAKGGDKEKKGKKKRKNRTPSKKWEKYKDKAKSKICLKCGPGIFLAEHKDRYHCGRCGYTEFKKQENKKEE